VLVAAPSRPVRILVIGDSTASATGAGLVQWAAANPTLAQVEVNAGLGCGLVPGGFLVLDTGDVDVDKECTLYRDLALKSVRQLQPDVVMLMSTVWDLTDRRLEKGGPALPPTDPSMAEYIAGALARFTDDVLSAGASRVVWIREPVSQVGLLDKRTPQSEAARHEVMWRIIDDIAATRQQVRVVDLATWSDQHGFGAQGPWRPDGVHWSPEASLQIADEFLGVQLINAALS
jgi:hypothetical protein